MTLVRAPMTNLKVTVRADCAVSTRNPSFCPDTLLPHSLPVRRSRPLDTRPPTAPPLPPTPPPLAVAGVWNKANFPFHQPGLFIGFWAVSSQTLHTFCDNGRGKDKEGAKPCLSKRLRDLHFPPFWKKGDTTHVQKGSLWVKSQDITPGHNESCSSQQPSLRVPSWLIGVCASREGPQGRSGVEK